ncbi:hypothetical protein JXB22_10370 [candidate division WOR-3 bacterium]|nr:hypothetical protein [candidate division WOR-3 bacterium]
MSGSSTLGKCILFITVIAAFVCCPGIVYGDPAGETARGLAAQWQDAIVGVKIVLESYDYESKIEVLGTVVDPSGIVVISLSSIDPGSLAYASENETKIKDVKIMLPDATEIPSEIVLRDRDLDLAFVRSIEKVKTKLLAIDLEHTAEPELADQICILSRLGSASGYAPHVAVYRIQSIITKPRTFYMPDFMGVLSGLGTPAFTLDGEVLGVMLMRISFAEGSGMGEMFGGIRSMGVLPVILPVKDIQKALQHIPTRGE